MDILVNNAAIHYDTSNRATAPDRRVVENVADQCVRCVGDGVEMITP
ncbi:MAG: hypothetical protein HRT86_09280 [Ilumatobacteraceae bacterium]|nr:hypothetical protein [Ilumatobacteraceae bacterium]